MVGGEKNFFTHLRSKFVQFPSQFHGIFLEPFPSLSLSRLLLCRAAGNKLKKQNSFYCTNGHEEMLLSKKIRNPH